MKSWIHYILLITLIGCASSVRRPNAVEGADPRGARIIDAHTHFHKGSFEAYLQDLKDAGVVGAILHLSAEETRSYKKLVPKDFKLAVCAAVRPDSVGVKEIERGIKDGRFQCMKIYLGYVPKYPADSFYTPFYKLAEKTSVPVVLHTGDTYDKMAKVKFADPLGVDEVAVTYPKAKFVIAHMGNPWFESAAEVVYKNDNVYVDLSALLIDDISRVEAEPRDYLVYKPIRWVFHFVENPKKFLFGTDYPLTAVGPYADLIKNAIPEKHWEDVFYWNAAELFGLDKRK